MTSPSVPRILLVEDDPVSRAFLAAAVQAVPAEVDAVDNFAAALSLAHGHDYACWLFDAHLGDGTGAELLARLREQYPHTPALAHTAATDAGLHDALIAAGFLEVLVKPLPAAAVAAQVRRWLGMGSGSAGLAAPAASGGPSPVWDDEAAALALNGNRAHIATLRALFVDELPRLRARIEVAIGGRNFDGLRADLHKLRASCGFVGAARLGDAARALHQHAESPLILARFDQAAQETLATAAPAGVPTGADQASPTSG